MIIKDLKDCPEFKAGDDSALRELFHPMKERLALKYSLAHAVVEPGARTRRHRLRNSEVYYILEGRGRMHIGDEAAEISQGQAVYIPPLAAQFIENVGESDLAFLCIVDPAWKAEEEEILPEGSSEPE
jgi:mannose-6-phosphate isomerase-like protein (cupin superfamily)